MKTTITSLMIVAMLGLGLNSVAQAGDHSDLGCDFCHVPHNAASTEVPLWSPGVPITVNFATDYYTSGSLDATAGAPDGASKLCLGCHDGATTVTGSHNPGANKSFGTGGNMGALSATHPISFVYDTALATADGELKDPAATPAVQALLDANNKVQCTSCHQVHAGSVGGSYLRAVYGSGTTTATFCRQCHVK